MRRSKELFEYLQQSGMTANDPPESDAPGGNVPGGTQSGKSGKSDTPEVPERPARREPARTTGDAERPDPPSPALPSADATAPRRRRIGSERTGPARTTADPERVREVARAFAETKAGLRGPAPRGPESPGPDSRGSESPVVTPAETPDEGSEGSRSGAALEAGDRTETGPVGAGSTEATTAGAGGIATGPADPGRARATAGAAMEAGPARPSCRAPAAARGPRAAGGEPRRPRTTGPRPARRRQRTDGPVSRPSGSERPSFGDQSISISYNNLALLVLFATGLLVLAYFLGFSQAIGDFSAREHALRTEAPVGGQASRSVAPGEAPGSDPPAEHEQARLEAPPGDDPDGPGLLEAERIVYTIRVFTADERNRHMAEFHHDRLRQEGLDAWLHLDRRGHHVVCVGRYDERGAELDELLAKVRDEELESRGRVERPYSDAVVWEVGPPR